MSNLNYIIKSMTRDMKSEISMKLKEMDKKKNVFKWPDIDLKNDIDNNDLERFNWRDVRKMCEIYEDIAKLSVDLYLDFEYFKKFSFKTDNVDEDFGKKLKELGYEKTDNCWDIIIKPEEDLVVRNIYINCYYKTLMEKLEKNEQRIRRESVSNKKSSSWKCFICESENEISKRTCSICAAERKEGTGCPGMEENRREEKCKKCNGKVYKDGLCRDCMKNGDSWTCKYEKCANENIGSLHCERCGIEKDYSGMRNNLVPQLWNGRIRQVWMCSRCDCVNDEDRCKDCKTCRVSRSTSNSGSSNSGNIDPISKPKGDRQPELESKLKQQRKWSCGVCHLLNDPKLLACEKCTKLKEGVWTCSWCTAMNEESMDNCKVCEKKRGEEPRNYCKNCQQKEKFIDELCHDCFKSRGQGWNCWYDKCKSRNEGKGEFCKKCWLHRKGKQPNGFVWQQREIGEKEQVWICPYCESINNINTFQCDTCSSNRID